MILNMPNGPLTSPEKRTLIFELKLKESFPASFLISELEKIALVKKPIEKHLI
jgi:hypothetical protein